MGSSGSGAQVENLALNLRSNWEVNKRSPRWEERQMEQKRGEMSFILLCFPLVFPRRGTWRGKQETDRWSMVCWVKLMYSCLIIQVWVLGQKKLLKIYESHTVAQTSVSWPKSLSPLVSGAGVLPIWRPFWIYTKELTEMRKELKKSLTGCQWQRPRSDHPHR